MYNSLFFLFNFHFWFDLFHFHFQFFSFLPFSVVLNAYNLAGDFYFVVLDPCVAHAPEAPVRSYHGWSGALMLRLRSYCCVMFHCSAHFEGLSIGTCLASVVDSFYVVVIKSRRVPISFCAWVGCSVFLASHSCIFCSEFSSSFSFSVSCRHLRQEAGWPGRVKVG